MYENEKKRENRGDNNSNNNICKYMITPSVTAHRMEVTKARRARFSSSVLFSLARLHLYANACRRRPPILHGDPHDQDE